MIPSYRRLLESTAILLILLLAPVVLHAQGVYLYTGNKYVTARVNQQTGTFIIYTTPGGYYGTAEKALTFSNETSFFTIEIGGKVYTNNLIGLGADRKGFSSDPRFGGYLMNATSRIIRGNGFGQFGYADTVETVWKLPVGDVIQQVYPVAFDFSGQIVMKWKFKNRAAGNVRVQSQYLLDTKIRKNDRAKVLTRSGYRRNWTLYVENNANYPPVPAFFQAFQQDLEPPLFDPILASQGTLINPELGLMKPDAVMVGQWESQATSQGSSLVDQLWSYPNPYPEAEYDDSAVLIIFPAQYSSPGIITEVGRTAYGTGEYESCTGDLYALIFRPRLLRANATGDDYKPNPFNVDVYLFNTNKYTEAGNTIATLEVGPYLKILEPTGTADGKSATTYADPKTVGVGGVSVAQYKVQAEKTCSGDTTWLRVSAKSTLGDPSFTQTCELPLPLPCLDKDTLSPIAEPEVALGYLKTIQFHDDRQKDKGIEKIEVLNNDPKKVAVTIDPFPKCTKSWVKVNMLQIDTTVKSCLTLKVTDCAGNITEKEICFPEWPPVPDIVKPRILLLGSDFSDDGSLCNAKWDTLLAVDDTLYDQGLQSIDYTPGVPPVNMQLVIGSFATGASRQGFVIRTLDKMIDGSISIRATDRAGNYSDYVLTYCTIPDLDRPILNVFQLNPYEWSVFVEDDRPYDRRLDTISIYNRQNVTLKLNGIPFEPTREYTRWQPNFSFNITVTDTSKFASFCVRAKDLADSSSLSLSTNWWSGDTCLTRDTVRDVWAPNITLDPPPSISPTVITVTVDDIHFINGQRVGWDKGIDSIWFTNVKGMVIPANLKLQCAERYTFEVSVSDTLAFEDRATICINVRDCAGNFSDTCWYYPIIPDSLPPIIQGVAATRTMLDIIVTDSTTYDRGLRRIVMSEHTNFKDINILDTAGWVINFPVEVVQPGRSSWGKLEAIDVFGMMSPGGSNTREDHKASIDLAVWVQDLAFKPSTRADQNATIKIPVNFVATDTFSLYRKNIREFEFTFDLVGHPGFSYVGYDQVNTSSEGMTIKEQINGTRITLSGSSSTPLTNQDSALIYVLIKSAADELTHQVVLTPVSVVFNRGADTVVTGKNSIAILPAPYGKASSGAIIAVGSCAPEVLAGAGMPKSIALGHGRPNPFSETSKLNFSVPAEERVVIALFNSLGEQIKTIVDEVMKPGEYTVNVSANSLPSGSYYVRMQSGSEVITRNLKISR